MMHQFARRTILVGLWLVFCGQVLGEEKPGEAPFLDTAYQPITKWLDESFEIRFESVSLELFFDQVPLNDVFYELHLDDSATEIISFESKDISRRELLKWAADNYNLEMFFKQDDQGTPTAIVVGVKRD